VPFILLFDYRGKSVLEKEEPHQQITVVMSLIGTPVQPKEVGMMGIMRVKRTSAIYAVGGKENHVKMAVNAALDIPVARMEDVIPVEIVVICKDVQERQRANFLL